MPLIDIPPQPPRKPPPWLKKEVLLPFFAVLFVGLIFGNYLVYRAIKKEPRYRSEYGPMDHRPSPARISPAVLPVVATDRMFNETNGTALLPAEEFSSLYGYWTQESDGDRTVMRWSVPERPAPEGTLPHLAYQVRINTPGRYQLWGLMRTEAAPSSTGVLVYWNREPKSRVHANLELKASSTNFVWTAAFENGPSPDPTGENAAGQTPAMNALPVDQPGVYTLYIVAGRHSLPSEELPEQRAPGLPVLDTFLLREVTLGANPPADP